MSSPSSSTFHPPYPTAHATRAAPRPPPTSYQYAPSSQEPYYPQQQQQQQQQQQEYRPRAAPPPPSNGNGASHRARSTGQPPAHPAGESSAQRALRKTAERDKKGDEVKRIGAWRIGRTIGKGSSGRVKLAKHSQTGQYAAIKIVPKHAILSSRLSISEAGAKADKVLLGIEREIVIMKLIDHPNVMNLYDVWETNGELYIIMEYVQGGELFDYLVSKGKLPPLEALHYFQQIIHAVDYCHRFNICHRDLKPENLLLDQDKNIKVADFGMAAWQAGERLLETSCGSPHYASPEIVAGKAYNGAASDIWSCGVILYALLSGRLPFDDDNIRVLLQKVKVGKFEMPDEIRGNARHLLSRMMDKNPETRITMPEIINHPFFISSPRRPIAGREFVVPPSIEDIDRPVTSEDDIDPDILGNLRTLFHGEKDSVIIKGLLSHEKTWEKTIYHLLQDYRAKHLENFNMDDEEVHQSRNPPQPIHPQTHTRQSSGSNPAGAGARRHVVSHRRKTSVTIAKYSDKGPSPHSSPSKDRSRANARPSAPTPTKASAVASSSTSVQDTAGSVSSQQQQQPPRLPPIRMASLRAATPRSPVGPRPPLSPRDSANYFNMHSTLDPNNHTPLTVPAIQVQDASPQRPTSLILPQNLALPPTPVLSSHPGSPVPSCGTPTSGGYTPLSFGNSLGTPASLASPLQMDQFEDAEDDNSDLASIYSNAMTFENHSPGAGSVVGGRPASVWTNSSDQQGANGVGLGIQYRPGGGAERTYAAPGTGPNSPALASPYAFGGSNEGTYRDSYGSQGSRGSRNAGVDHQQQQQQLQQQGAGRAPLGEAVGVRAQNTAIEKPAPAVLQSSHIKSPKLIKKKPLSIETSHHHHAPRQPRPAPQAEPNKRSWFSNLFSFKAPSYTLYSLSDRRTTLSTARHLLESYGVVCTQEGPSLLRCKRDEIRDPSNIMTVSKAVKFRVEVSACGEKVGSASGFVTMLVMVQEKGALSTLKGVYGLVKRDWELDGPRTGGGGFGKEQRPSSPPPLGGGFIYV